jgi:hypothetical protein
VLPQFKWTTGLTGAPASNGYKDLHGQYLVVDGGLRLGTSKSAFMSRYYKKSGYKDVAYNNTEDQIKQIIGDITLEMSAADYNPLPDMIINDLEIEMPSDLRAQYEKLEREYFLKLDNGAEVEVFNAASMTNKCLQFSNGAVYPDPDQPMWEEIHDLKLEALEDILEEANGQPVLCAYAYVSDAHRIMQRFKDLRPINLTACKSEKSLNDAMKRWVAGDCPLMIGHPACLHPETQILTKRAGWIKLIEVMDDDMVFDGVEFVTHRGCHYSGYKEVIDLFGITMTPDHKLLIRDEWKEVKDVQDTRDMRTQALFQWESASGCECDVPDLWRRTNNDSAECDQEQSVEQPALFAMHRHHISPNDQYSHLEYLAGFEVESTRQAGQELRWARDNHVFGMGGLQSVLCGYVGDLLGRSDNRTDRRQQAILQRELQMGDPYGAAKQQTEQPCSHLQGRTNAPCGTLPSQRIFQNDVDHATEQGDDSGRRGSRLRNITLREEPTAEECATPRKAHVYDLVDCGPRHQFLIRNGDGEMFISHNSMGHGIDGLQHRGHILAWFGLNWSLDLYDQFNARIRRQGQGAPVICHRILCADTLDQAQAMALDSKATTQASLRAAVKEYRKSKEKD